MHHLAYALIWLPFYHIVDLKHTYFNLMFKDMEVNIKNRFFNIITVGVAGCTVLGTDTFPLDVLSKW